MLRSIVYLKLAITSLVSKSKLIQNRKARDRLSAAEVLNERVLSNWRRACPIQAELAKT